MQLNSIEGIKTAVSLGLGAAFVSSSAIEKEIELKTIEILKSIPCNFAIRGPGLRLSPAAFTTDEIIERVLKVL